MAKNTNALSEDINDAPFVLTRSFDAPRDLLWKVWTQSEHLGKWFSPKGFKILAAKMDFRVGGTYHYGLETPDGQPMWGKWEFREIAAPERTETSSGSSASPKRLPTRSSSPRTCFAISSSSPSGRSCAAM